MCTKERTAHSSSQQRPNRHQWRTWSLPRALTSAPPPPFLVPLPSPLSLSFNLNDCSDASLTIFLWNTLFRQFMAYTLLFRHTDFGRVLFLFFLWELSREGGCYQNLLNCSLVGFSVLQTFSLVVLLSMRLWRVGYLPCPPFSISTIYCLARFGGKDDNKTTLCMMTFVLMIWVHLKWLAIFIRVS